MAAQAVVIAPIPALQEADAPGAGAPPACLPPPPSDLGSTSEEDELEVYFTVREELSLEDLEDEDEAEEQPAEQPAEQPSVAGAAAGAAAPAAPLRPPQPLQAGLRVPSREALAASPDFPVLVTAEAVPGVSLAAGADPDALPINSGRPIPFESDLFAGQACVFIRGLRSSPPGLFKGQKRKTLLVVQGQFRGEVGFEDLVTGQEFSRARNLPPAWLLDNVLLKVARSISPSMTVGPAKAPFMLMPVVAGCNQLHVARPGQAPALTAEPCEDMRLVDPRLVARDGSPLPFAKRRTFFSDPANRAGRAFDPSLVWTFYFYQHLVDVSSYTLNMVYKFQLHEYLDGQPLQLMMKDRARGRYLFRFHMFHEVLLRDAERAAQRQSKRALLR